MTNIFQGILKQIRAPLANLDVSSVKEAQGFGYLSLSAIIAALGLLIIAIADNGARTEQTWANMLYWTGLIVLFVPLAFRILSPNISREERLGLVLILGVSLYLVKIFYAPIEFKYPDELQHWRTENNILRTGRLFTDNYALPVSPFYPGLQIVTNAIIQLTGFSIFNAGVIVIGTSRVLLTLALYLFYEKVSLSSYLAGMASVIYMVNPHYLFVNSFYIYQTLAIALMAFGLYSIAHGEQTVAKSKFGMKIILLLALTAVVVTHHVTSYIFLFFLVIWFVAVFIIQKIIFPGWIVLLAVVENISWIIFIALCTIEYFKLPFMDVVENIISLIGHEQSINGVFRAPTGPMYERMVNYGVVGLIAMGLLLTIWVAWKRFFHNPLAFFLIIGSLGYFGSLIIRVVSSQGAELSGRSWPFIFIPVAFVLAIGIREVLNRWLNNLKLIYYVGFTILIAFLFVGSIMGGEPAYYERLPGPYLAGSYERAVEPQGVAAAKWVSKYLGRDNRVSSDFINYTLMGTYGEQDPVRAVFQIFYSLGKYDKDVNELLHYAVRYLIVDDRLGLTLPASGRYFDIVDPQSYHLVNPIDPIALTKFDYWDDVNRIFDTGHIVIYDFKGLYIEE